MADYILTSRYLDYNETTFDDMCTRVIDAIVDDNKEVHDRLLQDFKDKKFSPGGRVNAYAGTKNPLAPNCVVLPLENGIKNILHTLKRGIKLQQEGCGLGFNYSSINFKNHKKIKQFKRDILFRIDHPDIYNFIKADFVSFSKIVIITDDYIKNPNDEIVLREINYNDKYMLDFPIIINEHKTTKGELIKLIESKKDIRIRHISQIYQTKRYWKLEDTLDDIIRVLEKTGIKVYNEEDFAIDFSDLREANSLCKTSKARSGGPIAFIRIFDVVYNAIMNIDRTNLISWLYVFSACATIITQYGRNGANMGICNIENEEIYDFITVKTDLNVINNYNLSILFSKQFFDDLDNSNVRYHIRECHYDKNYIIVHSKDRELEVEDLWNIIITCSYNSGEPGVIFRENLNKDNFVKKYFGDIITTNPCVITGTKLLTDKGNINIEELINTTVNVWTGEKFTSAIVKITGKNKEVFRVILSDERELTCTASHEFIIESNNKLIKKQLKDIDIEKDSLWNPKLPYIKYHSHNYKLYIKSIDSVGIADTVYCCTTLDDSHRATFNNIVTGNCGEISLYPNECCNLTAINLEQFVKSKSIEFPNTLEQVLEHFDIIAFKQCIRDLVWFLNNVIDKLTVSDNELLNGIRKFRRCGLGFMGFSNMLLACKVPYCSQLGREVGEYLAKTLSEETDIMSRELTRKYQTLRKTLSEDLPEILNDSDDRFDRVNIALTCCAPTGSTAILLGTSYSIEPEFRMCYKKVYVAHDKEDDVFINKYFKEYLEEHNLYSIENVIKISEEGITKAKLYTNNGELFEVDEKTKDLFKNANEITPIQHCLMQAAFQKHIDNSISKTVNFPNSATIGDIGEMFKTAYRLGCKGCTVYRDGCRESQVMVSLNCKNGTCDL